MINVFSLWDVLYRPVHGVTRTHRELERMSGSASETARSIAAVVSDVLNGTMTADELGVCDRIERLRKEMNGSDEQLAIADYGAQSPLKHLSAETMYKGRTVSRTVGDVCRSSSKPRKWSLFLFRLIRTVKPSQCLELGTCLGISGAYIGSAMTLNGTGVLVTIEGAEALAQRARHNFTTLGLTNIDCMTGRFQDVLGTALEKLQALEAVFIDGHHDGPATLAYFETIAPSLAPGAVVVFDDIGWSMEMRSAWRTLRAHERVSASIDMFDMGICCIGTSPKEQYTAAV